MSMSRIPLSVFAILAVATIVWASEFDELREKSKAMQREAAELAERGRNEEAADLERRAMDMLEEAERLQHHRPDQRKAQMMEMRRRMESLRAEEKELEELGGKRERLEDVRREVERVEVELRSLSGERNHQQDAPHEDIARRLEHMRIAVDHLNQAGLHEIAEHVGQRAEAARRELHEQERRHEAEVGHEVLRQLDELRHQVERLRDEVNELRKTR